MYDISCGVRRCLSRGGALRRRAEEAEPEDEVRKGPRQWRQLHLGVVDSGSGCKLVPPPRPSRIESINYAGHDIGYVISATLCHAPTDSGDGGHWKGQPGLAASTDNGFPIGLIYVTSRTTGVVPRFCPMCMYPAPLSSVMRSPAW